LAGGRGLLVVKKVRVEGGLVQLAGWGGAPFFLFCEARHLWCVARAGGEDQVGRS